MSDQTITIPAPAGEWDRVEQDSDMMTWLRRISGDGAPKDLVGVEVVHTLLTPAGGETGLGFTLEDAAVRVNLGVRGGR